MQQYERNCFDGFLTNIRKKQKKVTSTTLLITYIKSHDLDTYTKLLHALQNDHEYDNEDAVRYLNYSDNEGNTALTLLYNKFNHTFNDKPKWTYDEFNEIIKYESIFKNYMEQEYKDLEIVQDEVSTASISQNSIVMHYIQINNTEMIEMLLDVLYAHNNKNQVLKYLNYRNIYGKTALMIACQVRNEKTVKQLITMGVNITLKDQNGNTPLKVMTGNSIDIKSQSVINIVKLLNNTSTNKSTEVINYDKTSNEVADNSNNTNNIEDNTKAQNQTLSIKHLVVPQFALMVAISERNTTIAKFLIKRLVEGKQNLAVQDAYGNTPIIYAIEYNMPKIAKLLIENIDAKDLNIQNSQKQTPLMLIIAKGHQDLAKLLIKKLITGKQKLEMKNEENNTSIMIALVYNMPKIAKLLIENIDAKDLNIQNSQKQTALIFSIELGYENIAKLLIKKLVEGKQNLALQDVYGNTSMLYAVEYDMPEIAKLLIKKTDAQGLNIQNNQKQMALTLSIGKGYKTIAKLLIKKLIEGKQNLALQDGNGSTAIMIAIIQKHEDIAEILISHILNEGGTLNTVENSGNTALIIAIYSDMLRIAQILIDNTCAQDLNFHNNTKRTALTIAVVKRHKDIVAQIVKKLVVGKQNLGQHDENKNTILMIAIELEHVEIAKLLVSTLVELGENLNVQNNQGKTAIMLAACIGLIEIVETLLETNKIDLTVKDSFGQTVLKYSLKPQIRKMIENKIAEQQVIQECIDKHINIYITELKEKTLEYNNNDNLIANNDDNQVGLNSNTQNEDNDIQNNVIGYHNSHINE